MDYKKLFNILMDESKPNILDYVDDASEAIKELLIENQALRNAANGFKDQAKKAEEEVRALKKVLSAVKNMEKFYPKDTEFFVFTKDQADEITKRAVLAEERAEKAKMKLDSAIEQLHGYCHACKNYTPNHNEGPCKTCKHEYFHCRDEKVVDNWKWLGEKEE